MLFVPHILSGVLVFLGHRQNRNTEHRTQEPTYHLPPTRVVVIVGVVKVALVIVAVMIVVVMVVIVVIFVW